MNATGLDRLLRPEGAASTQERPSGSGENGRIPSGAPELLRLDDWQIFATPRTRESIRGRPLQELVTGDGRTLPLLELDDGSLDVPFDLEEAYRNYLTEAWAGTTIRRRLSSGQLDAFYRVKRFVPRGLQLGARRALIRLQGTPSFPRWPLDDGVQRLLELHARCLLAETETNQLAFRWFWPDGHRAALVLTHDVESSEGIRLAVELADLEESLGFRSTFNFGAWYRIDPGILRDLTARGFEIGMHGIAHDRSLFSSRVEFERQLPLLRDLADRLGAVGFRSPATHRVFEWLAELPVAYDGTIPHSDPYEPQPGGCCSLWPFFIGDLVELPYTLPQDHTLLTLLGRTTAGLWLETAAAIEGRFGLIHCISHPDPGYLGDARKRAVYAEFLAGMAERPAVWRTCARDVAEWWRRRDATTFDSRTVTGLARSGSDPSEVLLAPPDAGAPGPGDGSGTTILTRSAG